MGDHLKINKLSIKLNEKNILNNINLSLIKGESLVIIGSSGSGKSVLLKCILGLIKPNSGEILIDNKNIINSSNIEYQNIIKNIGVTFQSNALFDSLSIYENIIFKIKNNKIYNRKSLTDLAENAIEMVGLDNTSFELLPSQLSGGMQKRIAIARAIIDKPNFLFFDEPTTGLDPINSEKINNLIIENVKKLGASAITITHDYNSLKKIGDKVALVNNGKIEWYGKVAEIYNSNNDFLNNFLKAI